MDQLVKTIGVINRSLVDYAKLRTLLQSGVTCIAVQGRETDRAMLDKVQENVRSFSENIPLLLDLEGPVLQFNSFPKTVRLKKGEKIDIGSTSADVLYPITYPQLYRAIKPGQQILLEGGGELVVEDIVSGKIECRVVVGADLLSGSQLQVPNVQPIQEVMTESEKALLQHALITGWDFVANFSLQGRKSIADFKEFTKGSDMKVLAKIGTKHACENVPEILVNVDGILFDENRVRAEVTAEEIETVQASVLEKSTSAGKLSIALLPETKRGVEKESIVRAVFAGADALMFSLSSENAADGVKLISTIGQTASVVSPQIVPNIIHARALDASITADAITKAAGSLCIEMSKDIDKVLVVSKTGLTARLLSRYRIPQPIFAFVSRWGYVRTTSVSRGIVKVYLQESTFTDRDTAVQQVLDRAKAEGVIKVSERILLICRTPMDGDHYFPNVFEVVEVK